MTAHQQQSKVVADKREIRRLVSAAVAQGAPDTYAGKRASERIAAGMRLDVTTDPAVPHCAWPVVMHNISDGGFAFWSKIQLRNRTEIWVREFSADNDAPWIPAQVTHCTVGIKGYLIGAAFGPTSVSG